MSEKEYWDKLEETRYEEKFLVSIVQECFLTNKRRTDILQLYIRRIQIIFLTAMSWNVEELLDQNKL